MAKFEKVCAWGCGINAKNPMTKEHYWAWMRKYDAGQHGKTYHVIARHAQAGATALLSSGVKSRQGSPLRQSLRVVCKTCNNGWMSQVQETAKPALTRLIEGEDAPLTDADAVAISRWATMFSMTWEFADPETMATAAEERSAFKLSRTPPAHWIIAIAMYSGTAHHAQTLHIGGKLAIQLPQLPVALPALNNFQATTFVVGRLMLHTVSAPIRFLNDSARYACEIGACLVFPSFVTSANFIPSLDESGVDGAHLAFARKCGFTSTIARL